MYIILQIIKPNSNTITYNNGNKVSNKLLIKTLNMKEWEDGRIKAVNLNGPIICNIKSGNWYFIIHPDGTQITCKFT
jgi:archaeosine-15-forming tRNA-guanine transglycosylase